MAPERSGAPITFVWVRSRDVVVERNLIVNCDRGIAFGNPGGSTANATGERNAYVADSIVRNNMIAGGADCGIELWYVEGIKVYHNTIRRPQQHWNRGIRIGKGTSETDIINNLVHGEITLEGGQAVLRRMSCIGPGSSPFGLSMINRAEPLTVTRNETPLVFSERVCGYRGRSSFSDGRPCIGAGAHFVEVSRNSLIWFALDEALSD